MENTFEPLPKIYILEQIVTKEFLDDLGPEIPKRQSFEQYKKDTGEDAPVYFFTFLRDEYSEGKRRLVLTNKKSPYFWATFPEDEAEQAGQELGRLNPHLKLTVEKAGYEGNDVVMMRITAKVKFETL